jgi:predicted transcriptional regulator
MTDTYELTAAEEKLAEMIWRSAPLSSPDLVALAEKELGWKKSTTYTVLKKLCDKGVVKNDRASITVLLTRQEQRSRRSRHFVEEAFGGSLPGFIASFAGGKALEPEQIAQLRQLIEEHERGAR